MKNLESELKLRGLVKKTRVTTPDCSRGLEKFKSWFLVTISGVPVCGLIIGESGTGKTILIEMVLRRFEAVRTEYGIQRRVVSIQVPECPTPISLLEALLEALGDPRPERGTRTTKMRRLVKAIKDQGVLFIVLDELQHFVDKNQGRVLYDASDCLKQILSLTNVSIIAAGLAESKMVVDSNEQLKRRFVAPVRMHRYDWADKTSKAAFIGLVDAFKRVLPMFELPKLESAGMAFRMYLASGGLIDYVAKILIFATNDAIDRKSRKITLPCLMKARDDALWDAENVGENPFNGKFDASKDVDAKIAAAKRINQRVARPISRTKGKARLAMVGI